MDSSPARTVVATISASFLAFPSPRQPIISRASDWHGSLVPPPTVPISTAGILTQMYRSPSISSQVVMVMLAPTTWAGSWPVAMYRAAAMLAAWALAPRVPAMLEPTRFLR